MLSNPLQDLGYGLTQGNNIQSALQAAGQRTAQMEQPRAQAEIMQRREQERLAQVAEQKNKVNQTVQYLRQQGREDLAQMAEAGYGGEAWGAFVKGQQGDAGEYGLTPIYGQDANGNTVVLQPSKSGGLRQAAMPEGVSLATGVDKIDLGTQWGLVDKRTGQMVGVVPKDNYTPAFDAASGGAAGKSVTEARLGAPQAIAAADQSIALIDELATDPNLEWAIGMAGVAPPIPGTPQAGVVSRIDQLQGRAFLEAFESLKGGGQITEVEGRKATEAIARLNRVQNKQDFLQALKDIRDVIETGKARAQRAGASGMSPGGVPAASSIDSILEKYR